MAVTQAHFRFRTDGNAVDATPTWGANEDANPSPATTPFRLRLGLNGTSAASGEFEIYAQKNAGSYAAITTSATGGVQSYDASSDADNTALLVPRLTMSVAWWLAGAAIDLDFAGDQIYPSGAFTDYLSCSRASDGYAKNSAGDWVQFSSNVLRRTDLGLLLEDSGTNYLVNSATPATQETESLSTGDYTLWVEGSGSAIASNGTGTITGAESATDGAPSIFTITGAGTVNVTVTGTLNRFQLEKGAFASSYIATGATSAVRAADVVTVVGSLDTLLKATAKSVVMDMQLEVNNSASIPVLLNYLGQWSTQMLFFYAAAGEAGQIKASGGGATAPVAYSGGPLWTTGAKAGNAVDASGFSLVMGGGTVATDANAISPTGNILINENSGGNPRGYYYLRRLTGWTSKLADATLQGLTAP